MLSVDTLTVQQRRFLSCNEKISQLVAKLAVSLAFGASDTAVWLCW